MITKCGILRQLELRETAEENRHHVGPRHPGHRPADRAGVADASRGARGSASHRRSLSRPRLPADPAGQRHQPRRADGGVRVGRPRPAHRRARTVFGQSLRERRRHRRRRILHDRERRRDAPGPGVRVPELLPSREARCRSQPRNRLSCARGEPGRGVHERGRARGDRRRLVGGRRRGPEVRAHVLRSGSWPASCSARRCARRGSRRWSRHPTTSTWGAFQCYGSPEYRLRSTASAERPRFSKPPVSRGELIARLRSLAERAGGARGADLTRLVDEFRAQKTMILDGERWHDGETLAELANLAASSRNSPRRSSCIARRCTSPRRSRRCRRSNSSRTCSAARRRGSPSPRAPAPPRRRSRCSCEAIELARLARREAAADRRTARAARLGPQALGDAHRAATSGSNTCARRGRPTAMRDSSAPGKESYQLLNWLALGYLLKKQRRPELVVTGADRNWTLARRKNDSPGDRSFWDRVAVPDALLHVALFEGSLQRAESRRRDRRRVCQRAGDRSVRARARVGARSPRVPGGDAARPGVETEDGRGAGRRAPAAHRTAALMMSSDLSIALRSLPP